MIKNGEKSVPEERRKLREKEEDVIPEEELIGGCDGDFGLVIGRPILGDEVLEIDGGNLSNGHVAVGVDDDLEEAHRMLWGVLHLLQPLLSALPFIGIRTQSSLKYATKIHLLPFASALSLSLASRYTLTLGFTNAQMKPIYVLGFTKVSNYTFSHSLPIFFIFHDFPNNLLGYRCNFTLSVFIPQSTHQPTPFKDIGWIRLLLNQCKYNILFH